MLTWKTLQAYHESTEFKMVTVIKVLERTNLFKTSTFKVDMKGTPSYGMIFYFVVVLKNLNTLKAN